jgi:hypothetical protein
VTENEREALQKMSLARIRKCQDLVSAQIREAYQQGNTKALSLLQQWEQDYADEIYRRCFT